MGLVYAWETLAAFGAGAAPDTSLALHPTEWSLQSGVFDDQQLFVYAGHWDLAGSDLLPLGSGEAGGTVWGADANDLFGVLSNPTAALRSSIYASSDFADYASLDLLDGVGVPAWSPEFNEPRELRPGDFDGNQNLDAADIDLLSQAVRDGNHAPEFDLNRDQQVNQEDRRVWVDELKRTYFGDANLDGEFNSADFVHVFQIGVYEDSVAGNAGWNAGDGNGDGDFESGDFVLAFQSGGYEIGPRLPAVAIPEPAARNLSLTAFAWLAHRRRRGKGSRDRQGE